MGEEWMGVCRWGDNKPIYGFIPSLLTRCQASALKGTFLHLTPGVITDIQRFLNI